MKKQNHASRSLQIAVAFSLAAVMAGCGKKDEAPAAQPAAAAPAAAQASVIPAAAAVPTSWTPEAMEELLAPIALYPDPILMQVLTAAANPQEVLDAGNWLLQNQTLKGEALGAAAEKVGFTPPTRALLPFPATLDMMCQEMAWTTELGQAFTADQPGVLAAVQRLRFQAQEVGNLKDSPQMDVAVEDQEGEQVIYIKPADPEVVYVPQYDSVAAYAPPATTTTVIEDDNSGELLTTGLLAFGAGMLVNEIFDDDDWDDNYYPHYGYGGGYNYNNYPYRPAYGNGYYPSNGYNRPGNYNNGWQNTGNINTGDVNINTGGNRTRQANSPITRANPNRDMAKVNQRASGNRAGATAGSSNWKGQSGYAGAKKSSTGRPSADTANRARDQTKGSYAGAQQGQRDGSRTGGKQPKAQGSYAGAKSSSRDGQHSQQQQQRSKQQQRPQQNQQRAQQQQRSKQQHPQKQHSADRGHSSGGSRQQQASRQSGSMSGASRGGSDRTASQRGQQSSGGGGGQQRSRR
jgi:hypothetical protein